MLKIDNLAVYYGEVKALHGISLEVKESSIVALLGANGAGKTTTLRSISGLIKPASGSKIQFAGQEITAHSPESIVSKALIHVPEGRQIFPGLTVMENLKMGSYLRRDKGGVMDDLEKVFALFPRLAERKNQRGGTLSGGEQQMLAIGRGLMARPKLLMLDEPSLGLAPVIVEKIFEVISEIKKQGITILLVEQNANLTLSVSDYAYVYSTGRVAMHGPTSELLKREDMMKAYLGGKA